MSPPVQPAEPLPPRGRSFWGDAWRRFRRNRLAVGALLYLSLMILGCFLGPLALEKSPTAGNLAEGFREPGQDGFILGSDKQGRDLLARILAGGQVSLEVGLLATLVAVGIGATYGATSALLGGRVDRVMMRLVDMLYAMPFIVFVLLLMVLFERQFWLIFVAIGAVEWLTLARIVRGQVLSLKERAFVHAARACGQSLRGILLRHLLPNSLGIIIVYTTLTIPAVMLLEAFISFLGFGVQAPDTSWGALIQDGQKYMEDYPWLLLYPSLFFATTLFALNFLGDGLRDAFDPRRTER
ncbi:MAG: ABC transporter permease [Opitutales bacterium]